MAGVAGWGWGRRCPLTEVPSENNPVLSTNSLYISEYYLKILKEFESHLFQRRLKVLQANKRDKEANQ